MDLEQTLKRTLAKKEQSIRKHTDLVLREAERLLDMSGICDERIANLVKLSCEYHDYGKVNAEFQKRVKSTSKKFNDEKEVPHNVLSYFFVKREYFETDEDYYLVACAVLYHHYHGSDIGSIFHNKMELIEKLLKPFSEYIGKTKRVYIKPCQELLKTKNREEILIKGFLHRCDYSASAGIPCEYENDFLQPGLEKLLESWKKENVNAGWNDLQIFCKDHRDQNVMITAPTGMGKTEAGLLWIGNKKGFFVLPLRTAINAMYDRICHQLVLEKKEEKVALLHSDMQAYYFEKGYENEKEEDLMQYCVRSRQMALPLTVCTPDQIFDFVYQYPGYEYKLATFAYSRIIIDEIQMYSPDLLAYLVYGIKRIHEMGGKVAVLTATLPPFVREKIREALNGDVVEANYADQGIVRHNVKVIEDYLNADDIIAFCHKLEKNKTAGRNILVVCNSIEIAQKIYLELVDSEIASEYDPQLLHSHFIKCDRAEKEQEILADGQTFNEDGSLHCGKKIWISTSLVEASLDIDFDYLFTELFDLLSLFQRMGRCNRKGKRSCKAYNCYVYTEKQGAAMRYVDQDIFQLSRTAILKWDGLLSEQQKDQMISEALSVENLTSGRSNYVQAYTNYYNEVEGYYTYEKDKDTLRDIRSVQVIPYRVYKEHEEELQEFQEQLRQQKVSMAEKIRIREQIQQYSLSISAWQYDASEKMEKSVQITSKWKIPVIKADYDKHIGFQVIKIPKEKKEDQSKFW
ncbi:MAG: CRISPR-associated helicase Cas3' [Lachnospiraceae bacterium]|nr:CRISPR-associated helicase Cas3' [Lachnospiraceae bacterium]